MKKNYEWKTLIVIPAYNEQGNIKKIVEEIKEVCPEFDYLVVNDGSNDRTVKVLKKEQYHYIDLPVNLGLSGAFNVGMQYAKENAYEAVIQIDADGQHDPKYIKEMVDEMKTGGWDIVIGSRFLNKKRHKSLRMFGNSLISTFGKIVTKKTLTDPTSGMRLYSRRLIREFVRNGHHEPEPHTVVYLMTCGAKVKEIPVTMRDRTEGESYFNMRKASVYMMKVVISILLLHWYHQIQKKTHPEKELDLV
ncbi:MAG: glycosyltransferase family 2 protein [Lachnospiraceae bacterium]|jgi:glycosyltransferase involved in cell wall biosynthesis|nr:glycosyltransferase family 2 protein [Lachnospiraceae bacterium]